MRGRAAYPSQVTTQARSTAGTSTTSGRSSAFSSTRSAPRPSSLSSQLILLESRASSGERCEDGRLTPSTRSLPIRTPQSWVALSDSITPLILARTASGISDRAAELMAATAHPAREPSQQRREMRGRAAYPFYSLFADPDEVAVVARLTREMAILGAHRSRRPISQVTTQARSTAGTSTTSQQRREMRGRAAYPFYSLFADPDEVAVVARSSHEFERWPYSARTGLGDRFPRSPPRRGQRLGPRPLQVGLPLLLALCRSGRGCGRSP
jgi:heat shock protein HspQ